MASTAYWALWFSPWDAPGRFSCHTCWISTSCPALHIHFSTQRNEMFAQCHKASKYLNHTTLLLFFCPREAASSFPNAGRSPFSKDNDENGWPHSRHISQLYPIAVVRWLSCVRLFETPWTAARQASLSFTISQSLCKFTFIESSNHLILCCPLFLLPSIFPSIGWALGLSQWAGSSHQMAKVLKHQHQSFQWISRVDFL